MGEDFIEPEIGQQLAARFVSVLVRRESSGFSDAQCCSSLLQIFPFAQYSKVLTTRGQRRSHEQRFGCGAVLTERALVLVIEGGNSELQAKENPHQSEGQGCAPDPLSGASRSQGRTL